MDNKDNKDKAFENIFRLLSALSRKILPPSRDNNLKECAFIILGAYALAKFKGGGGVCSKLEDVFSEKDFSKKFCGYAVELLSPCYDDLKEISKSQGELKEPPVSLMAFCEDIDQVMRRCLRGPEMDEYAGVQQLAKLTVHLLGGEGKIQVADICCGTGVFMSEVTKNANVAFDGYDVNLDALLLAEFRKFIQRDSCKAEISLCEKDVLNSKEMAAGKYDFIYVDPPLLCMGDLGEPSVVQKVLDELKGQFGFEFKTSTCAHWLWVERTMKLLKKVTGVAVVLMPGHIMSHGSSVDQSALRYLLNNYTIQKVISLPTTKGVMRHLPYIIDVMVIQNKNPNSNPDNNDYEIELVDGSELKSLEDVIELLKGDNKSKKIKKSELLNNARRVVIDVVKEVSSSSADTNDKVTNLGDLVDIRRGVAVRSDTMEEVDDSDTDFAYYLRPQNIIYTPYMNKAYLEGERKGIKLVKSQDVFKKENVKVKPRDLLLVKVLTPNGECPVLVAGNNEEEWPSEPVVLSSNLIALRLKEGANINLYYLAWYLNSKKGERDLQQSAGRGSLRILNKEGLENIKIPRLGEETEEEIGGDYKKAIQGMCNARVDFLKGLQDVKRIWEKYSEMLNPNSAAPEISELE